MAITDFLFPQGNFLNIRSNAPNQMSYNIDATRDLVENVNPFGVVGEVVFNCIDTQSWGLKSAMKIREKVLLIDRI